MKTEENSTEGICGKYAIELLNINDDNGIKITCNNVKVPK
jgi:hypothetical protein